MSIWTEERAYVRDRYESAVREVGFGDAWDHIEAQDDTAATDIMRGVLGAVASYLQETGYHLDRSSPAA